MPYSPKPDFSLFQVCQQTQKPRGIERVPYGPPEELAAAKQRLSSARTTNPNPRNSATVFVIVPRVNPANPLELVIELEGILCQCGTVKQTMQTFCGRCYHSLPHDPARALYRKIGNGYREAYEAAIRLLNPPAEP